MPQIAVSGSPSGSLNSTADWKSIGWTALYALAGFAADYLSQTVYPQINQGAPIGMMIGAAVMIAAKTIRQWMTNSQHVVLPAEVKAEEVKVAVTPIVPVKEDPAIQPGGGY